MIRVPKHLDDSARDFCKHLRRVFYSPVVINREYDRERHLAILYEPDCETCSPWIGEDMGRA